MTASHESHSVLGESIRAFAEQVEQVTRQIAELEVRGADAPAIAESTRALEEAAGALASAQEELEGDRQALEQLLEEERIRYSHLFEWAPDAYLVTDTSGTILEANRAAEHLLRWHREALVRTSIVRLLALEERAAFEVMLERLPMLERISDWELRLKRRDGAILPCALSVSWLADRERSGSLRWLLRDVSERKHAEEQMLSANVELERRVRERTAELEAADAERQEALSRLEAVLHQVPAAIVIADARSGEVVTGNVQATKLLAEVAGDDASLESWLALGRRPQGGPFPPQVRPLARALASGEPVSGELIEFERLDGTRAIFEMSAAPIWDVDGNIVAAVSAYWDVTERERRARAEREFITNAAHELRTPLAALASAVDVLQAGAKEDAGDRDRFLDHVEQQSLRLQRLVRSLLLLARLETGHEAAETEPVHVAELLDEVARLGTSERIKVELRCEPGELVLANRELAEPALLNLLANAHKYAPEGTILLSGSCENGLVSLEVADRGPGISEDERARAAERFYRGRQGSEADGFGLGLSIASHVATALNGRLELEPNHPAGTRARLLLPAADA